MGNAATVSKHLSEHEKAAGSKISKMIDKELAKERNESGTKFKILLLGGSECGKTTVFKQMRVLHLNGFTPEDIARYRHWIHTNAVESLFQLIEALHTFGLGTETSMQEDIDRFIQFRKSAQDNEEALIPVTIARCMERIWGSSSIQTVYGKRFTIMLMDSAKYFLNDLNRITEANYTPTTQDILHCRFRTTGINEIEFEHKKILFKMVDVGGQRSERRKWIHCFDNVDMILFVVAVSDYDLPDPEAPNKNRLLGNFEIFKTIVQSDFFKHASVVLFLNKYDIFQEKLQRTSLRICWPNYRGDNSVSDATEYVKRQFKRCVHDRNKYSAFVTTATDTNQIDLVFSSAVAHIVNENLKSTGLHE